MAEADTAHAIQATFRSEAPRIIAALARRVRDVGLAEELAQDALVAALEQWPGAGIPENPGAWLMAAAKHRAINHFRRAKLLQAKHAELGAELEVTDDPPDLDRALDDDIGDELLGLIFAACHPLLPTPARVALTLRLLGGLDTAEIARAFLLPEPTIAQRIVRAKRTLGDAAVRFEVPSGAERAARLPSVLEVVYLIFNEGYAATAGEDLVRPLLIEEALRLGRTLVELMPEEAEAHALLSLMELGAARMPARVGEQGEPVLLLDQDRTRWDQGLLRRGLAALEQAERLAAAEGPYLLQASIAACHGRAATAAATDWGRIAVLYRDLARLTRSPVVELNRAVAVSMADGPEAGLRLLDALRKEPALKSYPLLPSARADLLVKLGRFREAKSEFERAASMTDNVRLRERLLARAKGCRDP